MLMYQTMASLNDVQTILVSLCSNKLMSIKATCNRLNQNCFYSIVSSQNTQDKFGSAPEDCDQKEMYKLLVSTAA